MGFVAEDEPGAAREAVGGLGGRPSAASKGRTASASQPPITAAAAATVPCTRFMWTSSLLDAKGDVKAVMGMFSNAASLPA